MRHNNKYWLKEKYDYSISLYNDYLWFERVPHYWSNSFYHHSEHSFIRYKYEKRMYEGSKSIKNYSKAPKYFRKMLNKKERRKSDKNIKNEVNGFDKIYSPKYKGADWDWW